MMDQLPRTASVIALHDNVQLVIDSDEIKGRLVNSDSVLRMLRKRQAKCYCGMVSLLR